MPLEAEIRGYGERALAASRTLALLSTDQKNAILESAAQSLDRERNTLKAANTRDISQAEKAGLSSAMIDRLTLNDKRIDEMVSGLRDLVALPDPVGRLLGENRRPNGLLVKKVSVPIGVIAIVYESRPNVTADAAGLCIKSSNAVILRGGSEAIESNKVIAAVLQAAGESAGLPQNAVQLIQRTERETIRHLVQLEGLVDLAIPRGGEGLIRAVMDAARVPVIKHYKGVCHVFVERNADLETALKISENAKCQRPATCNAMETLLVDRPIAREFLPKMCEIFKHDGVELRGDAESRAIVDSIRPASAEDWSTEYSDLILSIRVVPDLTAAIEHINNFGSHHSDAIVTRSDEAANRFTAEVDSAAVFVNTSTRFTDGAQFGLGAEMGISTDKLHARGPMGLEELTSYKYIVLGSGQLRD